jgi:hypothetical protein
VRGLRSALHSLLSDFAGRCSAVTVYIAEAHAKDEWRLDGSVSIAQPRTTAERIKVAAEFAAAFHWQTPLLVDPPESEPFERLFAPWPLRFFIVAGQSTQQQQQQQQQSIAHPPLLLSYVAEPVGDTFDLLQLREHIESAIAAAGGQAADEEDQPMRA